MVTPIWRAREDMKPSGATSQDYLKVARGTLGRTTFDQTLLKFVRQPSCRFNVDVYKARLYDSSTSLCWSITVSLNIYIDTFSSRYMHTRSFIISLAAIAIFTAGFGIVYLRPELEPYKTFLLIALMLAITIGTVILIHFLGHAHRLRVLLKKTQARAAHEAPDSLQESYVQIYKLYLALPERKKQNFYGRIVKLRQTLEEQMKAAKKVQELIEKGDAENLQQLRERYEELYNYFQQLSPVVQQKYYVQVMHMKDKLEKGTL